MDKIGKTCSLAEIEKKRLLALQRREQAQLKAQSTSCKANNVISPSTCKVDSVIKQNRTHNRFNPIEPKNFFNRMSTVTGKCYMINNDRFALETSTFIPVVIDTFKTIPSRMYDAKTRIWNFHINDYDCLMQKLICLNSGISITKIPENILQIFKKKLKMLDNQMLNQDLSKIDKNLIDNLMPFQRDGVCYGISRGGRCMIADDMGLGKTIQALGIAYYFKENWPLLIVVPSSVKYQWSEAIYEFLPSVPTHYVHHFVNAKDRIGDEQIIIISYDMLARVADILEKHIFGFVILDESHVLKSNKTARFQAAHRICSQARHIVLLTGTPALSRPIELYSQINLIIPRFMRYEDYGIRYCAGQKTTFGWDFTGSSNMQELQLLLKSTCVLRRLKNDVLNQLPSKTRQVIILDPDLIKASNKQLKGLATQFQKKLTGLERHNALLQYYNESSFARMKAICNYVKSLFENKRKCLLYAHHQNVLDAICNVAESMKIQYIRIDGKTNPEQRKILVDKFQNCNNYLAAILSITAANAGITLTAAHLVVFTELFWNPGVLCQAEDRVHRIGQNDNVTIQYLVAKNTADDYMWPLIKKKLNVLNAAGLDQDFSINDIDAQKNKEQSDLSAFLNISLSSMEQSQQEEQKNSVSKSDKEQKNHSNVTASISADKELLEIDQEYFDFDDWDDVI
ncbi:hypothetical protein HN011_010895 [Eciton burchellii]|nr:hypothetical protein HN011_010895 [Eciton burchellii]